MTQTMPDTNFINEIFFYQGQKGLDVFKKNRLEKAIEGLKNICPIQGIAAQANYFLYFNQADQAIKTLQDGIKYYGNNSFLVSGLVDAYQQQNDWRLQKQQMEQLLRLEDSEIKLTVDVPNYIKSSFLYADCSGSYVELVQKYYSDHFDILLQSIYVMISTLQQRNCSLENYRHLIGIAFSSILERYQLNGTSADIRIQDDVIQVIFSNDFWTENEAIELTAIIHDAIAEIDDKLFQKEVKAISIFCIDCPLAELAEDFVYEANYQRQQPA